MNEKHETAADIIGIMRSDPLYNPHNDPAIVEANHAIRNYADRLDAAIKRETAANEGVMDVVRVIRFMFTPSHPLAATVVRGDVALDLADRLEAAYKRDMNTVRSKLYGVASGLRYLSARSDARERGVHYSVIQDTAQRLETIADEAEPDRESPPKGGDLTPWPTA